MSHPYDSHTRGLRWAVTSSLIIHAALLATLLTVGWSGQRLIDEDPVFVDIVSNIRQETTPSGETAAHQAPDNKSVDEGDEAKKAPQKTETKNTAKKTAVKIPAKQAAKTETKETKKPDDADVRRDAAKKEKTRASVEEALKRVTENVRKKDAAAAVESRIAEIRRKDEAEQGAITKGIADLKKGLALRPLPDLSSAKAQTHTGSGQPTAIEAKYPAYYSLIKDRVQAAWIYPEGFNANGVSIVISIKIGKSGKLIDIWIEKGSGNRNFDESLINAVRKASPFPPLPQDFKNVYLETGLRFCPLCKE